MALNHNKDLKLYYSISEVAEMFGMAETALRFWEKEFSNIKPEKNGRGVRMYTKEDIEQVRLVHNLVKERGLTLQGAREAIKHSQGNDTKIEVVERLKRVRDELQILGRELNELV